MVRWRVWQPAFRVAGHDFSLPLFHTRRIRILCPCASGLSRRFVPQLFLRQLESQPGARLDPVAPHRAIGYAQCQRGVALVIAGEEAAFDDLRKTAVQGGQSLQGFVDVNQGLIFIDADVMSRRKRLCEGAPAAFFRLALARVIDQYMPHGQCGCAQKVGAVVELRRSQHLQVGLVDQGSCLQCFSRAHPATLAPRQPPDVRVKQRHELLGQAQHVLGHLTGWFRGKCSFDHALARVPASPDPEDATPPCGPEGVGWRGVGAWDEMSHSEAIQHWAQVDRLLDLVLPMQPMDRAAFVEQQTADDPRLREEVMALLDELATRGDLLDRPAAETISRGAPSAELQAGHRFGAYRIVALLGRGGMGEVYRAARADGQFEHDVALKLLRQDSVEHLSRFVAERHILASLEHPGIARLYDAGVAEDGRPYMVMELVEGVPITAWCRQHKATLHERLDLFSQVCDAVTYAHQHLVIHRDLKPGNILVNAHGQIKLLDFGVAKLLSDNVEEATRNTPLTLSYAAPEQLTRASISTATDIYALGVLLFELLTERLPWAIGQIPIATAMDRVLHETAPQLGAIAANLESPAVPARMLTGDLDAIVAKTLRKQPADRYATVVGLQADLRRHVQGEPVQAREGNQLYVFGRIMRRYWLPATVMLALMVTMTGAAVYAQLARNHTEAALHQADTIRSFLIDLFALNEPEQRGGAPLSARELVDLGARRAEVGLGEDPDTRIALLGVVGTLYQSLGEYQQSTRIFGTRLAEAKRQYRADDERLIEAKLDVAGSELTSEHFDRARLLLAEVLAVAPAQSSLRANALSRLADLEDAVGNYPRAVEISEQVVALRRSKASSRVELADALIDLGGYMFHSGHAAAAEKPLREALGLLANGGNKAVSQVIHGRQTLSEVLSELARFDEARIQSQANVALIRQVYGPDHPKLANELYNLARIERLSGDLTAAADLYRQALKIYERVYGPTHSFVATTLTSLGQTLSASGQHQAAIDALERAELIYMSTLGPSHPYAAISASALADARLAAGDAAGAESGFRTSIARYVGSGNGGNIFIEAARRGLGEALCAQRRYSEGEPLLQQAWQRLSTTFGSGDYRSVNAAATLAQCLFKAGQVAQAETVLRTAQQALAVTAINTPKTAQLLATLDAIRTAKRQMQAGQRTK